jgi:hypothetical protein
MTYGLNGTYADLGPTQAELAALQEVIDEVLAEELLPGGDDEDGPWHDGASLANYTSERVDLAYASEAQRLTEDGLPLPRKAKTGWTSCSAGLPAAPTRQAPTSALQSPATAAAPWTPTAGARPAITRLAACPRSQGRPRPGTTTRLGPGARHC